MSKVPLEYTKDDLKALNKKQIQQIKSALHNTLEKIKFHIRRNDEVPLPETAFEWFQNISEFEIVQDKNPLDASDRNNNHFESIFFFNDLKVHLFLSAKNEEYRGRSYFDAIFNFCILNELNPDDYFDQGKIKSIKTIFDIDLE